jgi:hypothetical protein
VAKLAPKDSGPDQSVAAPATQPTTPKAGKPADEPKDLGEALGKGKGVFQAFKGGKWREAIAGCLVLLLFLWRRFASKLVVGKLSPWWTGFLTVLLGYLSSIPEALSGGAWSWSTFILSGLLTSAEAMLMWQMIGKRLLPKVFGNGSPNSSPS